MRAVFAVLPIFLSQMPARSQTPPEIPENLKAHADQQLLFQSHATTDFAGPTWRYSDRSEAAGKVIAQSVPEPNSVLQLLLAAVSHYSVYAPH